jgi:hypothetical protein
MIQLHVLLHTSSKYVVGFCCVFELASSFVALGAALALLFACNNKQGSVCHTVALPFTLKSILRQKKKNYGNSNISPLKNIIFPKKKIL